VRRNRAVTRALRWPRRGAFGARGDRVHGLVPGRPGRRFDSGRCPCARPRHRLQLADVALPRPRAARRDSNGSTGNAGRCRRRNDGCGRLQRRAVLERCRGRPRSDRRRSRGAWSAQRLRRHTRDRLAPPRCVTVRRSGMRCVQVVAVATRHGVHGTERAIARADGSRRRELVCRRRPLRPLLRPDAATRRRCTPSRPLAGLVHLGRDRARTARAGGDRDRPDPRPRSRSRQPIPSRARAHAGLVGHRLCRRSRCRGEAARAGIRAATRSGSLRASFHVYNTEDDVDAALTALLD
jgi:hypothetical protein